MDPDGKTWSGLKTVDEVIARLGEAEKLMERPDAPLLVTAGPFGGGLGIYDALTGDFLRRTVSGRALLAPRSNCSWIAVATLLTFWPPAPLDRTAVRAISSIGMAIVSLM